MQRRTAAALRLAVSLAAALALVGVATLFLAGRWFEAPRYAPVEAFEVERADPELARRAREKASPGAAAETPPER